MKRAGASTNQSEEGRLIRRKNVLYATAALLALVGLADAVYLTVEHITGQSVRCTIIAGCSEVLGSSYAVVAGFPLASIGAAAYFSAFSLATLTVFGYKATGRLLLILTAAMCVVSLWLIYLQAFVLHAFCQFCLISASICIALFLITLVASRASKSLPLST